MNVVIDVGNSKLKYALFEGMDMIATGHDTISMIEDIDIYGGGEAPDILVALTGNIREEELNELKSHASLFFVASYLMPLPIKLGYKTPETLGFDRIAGAVGGWWLYPDVELLIIDAGTAVTFDYVSAEAIFKGGNISPGLRLRAKVLNEETHRLPLVEDLSFSEDLGLTTESAIRNGIVNGMIFEIRGCIERFLNCSPNGKVILTGGDGDYFKEIVGDDVLFDKSIVMKGLNIVLEYQKTVNF